MTGQCMFDRSALGSPAASTAAIAVILTMPRAVTEGVNISPAWPAYQDGPTGSAPAITRVS